MARKRTSNHLEIARQMPVRELSTLLKVSSALAASLDLGVVLQTAIESTCEVLGVPTGAIYELSGESLFLGATTPPLPDDLLWLRLQADPLAEHIHIQQAMRTGQPVYVRDIRTERLAPAEAAVIRARELVTVLFIPLLLEEKGIGVLIVGTTDAVRKFSPEEIDLCRVLAYQVTLALTNARLFRSVQQSNVELTQAYDATLLGWSLALEMRDEPTQGHTRRVTQLTMDLARAMGVGEEALTHIRRGAMLHDIGKMSVPDSILRKEGPLSDEEWAVMRMHPGYAFQFLKQITYLEPALEIPYCHHEKWDGSGYPRGLHGEQIPLAARIFAVADVYDALTSVRPYRPAWPVDEARRFIAEQAGRHFDPAVVRAFQEWAAGEVQEARSLAAVFDLPQG